MNGNLVLLYFSVKNIQRYSIFFLGGGGRWWIFSPILKGEGVHSDQQIRGRVNKFDWYFSVTGCIKKFELFVLVGGGLKLPNFGGGKALISEATSFLH